MKTRKLVPAIGAMLASAPVSLALPQPSRAGDDVRCSSNGSAWACMRVIATSNRVQYVSTYTGRVNHWVSGKNVPDDGPVTYRVVMRDDRQRFVRSWPAYDWVNRRPSQGLDNMCTFFEGNPSWTNSLHPCVTWPTKYFISLQVNFAGAGNIRESDRITILK